VCLTHTPHTHMTHTHTTHDTRQPYLIKQALISKLPGANKGKLIVKLADEPAQFAQARL
jgi:hypothetical protein